MDFQYIIQRKRDGQVLTREEIEFMVKGISDGTLPDYQISAWAMAVYFRGMTREETRDLALAMAYSGDVADLSAVKGITVDKHSTGGVGDKTTLVVIPLAAAAGIPVAKMSGRGLGHTGGTIDKLESISGFKVEQGYQQFVEQVNRIGAAVVSQSGNLVPADKRLYAIRDVTATVESLPLIASSIMSKKIASGAQGIVLDVKVGAGAFMKNRDKALELARIMVAIGQGVGREVVALLTDMNQPLGNMVGNALEVREAIDTLKGQGPPDLKELSIELAAHMLVLGKKHASIDAARNKAEQVLASGQGLNKFFQMVEAQGGSLQYTADDYGLPQARVKMELQSNQDGYVANLDAYEVGRTAALLGAGREKIGDAIDYAAGIELVKKIGDRVKKGDTIAFIHASSRELAIKASQQLLTTYAISVKPVKTGPIILDVIKS